MPQAADSLAAFTAPGKGGLPRGRSGLPGLSSAIAGTCMPKGICGKCVVASGAKILGKGILRGRSRPKNFGLTARICIRSGRYFMSNEKGREKGQQHLTNS